MGRQVTSNDRRIGNVADVEARFLAGAKIMRVRLRWKEKRGIGH